MASRSIKVDHTAIKVSDVDWYVRFFDDVFGMTQIRADRPENPSQVWLSGGIQLVAEDKSVRNDGILHHLGLVVDDPDAISLKISIWNVEEIKPNWFALPNGLKLELKKPM